MVEENKDKKEVVPGTPSETDTYDIKRDRVKSIRQIGKESQSRIRKQYLEDLEKKEPEKKEEPKEEPKEEVKETPAPEPKTITEDEAKKITEEAVSKATEETKKEFQTKIDEILNKDKSLQEKQKEADELIAAWDKEERLPKDYKELINETQRIADTKATQRQKAWEDEQAKKQQDVEAEKQKAVDGQKAEEQNKYDDFNKQIAVDLDEIINAKLLPRPQNINEINNPDTRDKAAKEIQKIFKFGIDLNTKLKSEGKEPVTSLNKIYFLHYKPFIDAQPNKSSEETAGADAPVAGSEHTTPETPSDKIDYKQLHNESWPQFVSRLKKEALARMRAK